MPVFAMPAVTMPQWWMIRPANQPARWPHRHGRAEAGPKLLQVGAAECAAIVCGMWQLGVNFCFPCLSLPCLPWQHHNGGWQCHQAVTPVKYMTFHVRCILHSICIPEYHMTNLLLKTSNMYRRGAFILLCLLPRALPPIPPPAFLYLNPSS